MEKFNMDGLSGPCEYSKNIELFRVSSYMYIYLTVLSLQKS